MTLYVQGKIYFIEVSYRNLTLSDSERDTFDKIGQFLWITNHTQPDISCDVTILGSKLKDPTINELQTVNQ